MSLRRRNRIKEDDIDPMSSVVNMTDVMLVLAVGFMIFAIMSTGLEDIIFSDISPQEKQDALQAAQETVEIEQGEELDSVPENVTSSGSGFKEMGKTYQDPKTGKLFMVKNAT